MAGSSSSQSRHLAPAPAQPRRNGRADREHGSVANKYRNRSSPKGNDGQGTQRPRRFIKGPATSRRASLFRRLNAQRNRSPHWRSARHSKNKIALSSRITKEEI